MDKLPAREQVASDLFYCTLFDYACRLTKGNEHDAEDIASEAILKALQALEKDEYAPRAGIPFRHYVMKIARNIWLEQIRRIDVVSLAQDFDRLATYLLTTESPQERGNLLLEPVHKILAGFSAQKQQSLDLIVNQECDFKTAAMLMACPMGTVQSQLSRTRKFLHDWAESDNNIAVIPYEESHLNRTAREARKLKAQDLGMG